MGSAGGYRGVGRGGKSPAPSAAAPATEGRLSFAVPSGRGAPSIRSPEAVERCVDLNVFETANAGFAQAVYEEFLRNPDGVSRGVAPAVRERRRRGDPGAERADGQRCRRAGAGRRPKGRGGPRRSEYRTRQRDAAQGSGRTARRQHEREPHRPHRDDLPRNPGRRARGPPGPPQHRARRGRPRREDLLHSPDRLRDRPGGEGPSVDGRRARGVRRRTASPLAGIGGARHRGGHGTEGRHARTGGAGHQGRRDDGLPRPSTRPTSR